MAEICRLDRAFIRVSGPEAVGFLDNLLTQNVTRVSEAKVLYAALLTPQGKVIADMLLWDEAGGVVLETDPLFAAELLRRLSMYRLRAPVAIDDISAGMHAHWSGEPFAGAVADPRMPDGALGWRSIGPNPSVGAGGAAAYETRRLSLGVPQLAVDAAPEEVFGLEALLEELNGVDFNKGCFVGQENVSRMKRRATTRRKFCPLTFEGPPLRFGTPVTAGDVELGSVRTGAAGRCLALLRLDRAIAASAVGRPLAADGRNVRLDPPAWLMLPEPA